MSRKSMSKPKHLSQSLERIEIQATQAYTGLVPHPSHLAEFEKILPGSADRFFRLVEDEQRARIGFITSELHILDNGQKRGQRFTLVVSLASVVGVVVCAAFHEPWAAGTLAVSGLASFALAMVWGRTTKEQNASKTEKQNNDNSVSL